MLKKEGKTIKQDILKKIETLLRENINLDAKLVFTKIEKFLGAGDKTKSFTSGGIGYVHIDEKLQAEYLKWEEGIKQEWLETIENIRKGVFKEQKSSAK
jgi:hypothetical protein